jgi:hypothetical protein
MTTEEEFIKKLQCLDDESINYVNVLYRSGINNVLSYCKEHNINHRITPISGQSKKSDYIPCIQYHKSLENNLYDSVIVYNDGRIKKLINTEFKFYGYNNFKSYICYAGYSSIFIDDAGKIYRCINDLDNNISYGSVFDNFTPTSYVCPYDECSCEYFIPKELYRGSSEYISEDCL